MSLKASAIVLTLALLFGQVTAWPCSQDPQYSYFDSYGVKDLYYLPETHFDSEYIRIMNSVPDLDAENERFPERWGFDKDARTVFLGNYADALALTEKVERTDLEQALADNADRDRILADYGLLRNALRAYAETLRGEAFQARYRRSSPPEEITKPVPFDLEPYRPVLSEIPESFSLYLLGAVDYHSKNYAPAKTNFQAVLALEPEKRRVKTVWAAYMLGRTCLALNEPAEARECFKQVRALAAEGFPDPLGLALESWGWQGRAHLLGGEYLEAAQAYVEFRKLPGKWFLTRSSFYEVFTRAFKDGDKCAVLVQDAMVRRLVTAWLTGMQYIEDDKARRWLDVNATLPTEGTIDGADGLAWLAYRNGNMDAAARWLGQSDLASPVAGFVKAKLLLRDDKIEEGAALLATLAGASGEDRSLFYEEGYPYSAETVLRSAYSGSLLKSGRYPEALKELVQSDLEDAAFVALRIMSVPELAVCVEDLKKEKAYVESPEWTPDDFFHRTWPVRGFKAAVSRLEELLAQRLARQGDWEAAAPHYSTEKVYLYSGGPDETNPRTCLLAEEALSVGNHLKAAADASLSQRERAQHLFEAGRILRDAGDRLLGVWCLNEATDGSGQPLPGDTLLTDDARKRIAENSVLCGRRFHYRFMAADLMKQCAALLPDNDVLAAHALYLGGTWLKDRHPAEADFFYKTLVRRNPNLLIAQQADQLRWFPREFTDKILYTPLPQTYLRKRTLALLLGGGMLLLVAGVTLMTLRRRSAGKKPLEIRNGEDG